VGRQRIELAVGREATALALQPHLGTLNRRTWLPVIERVLDEHDRDGVHVRLDRLDLDLGTVPLGALEGLEDEVARRLEAALRRALAKALATSEGPARTVASAETRGELLEHYLRTGILPFWATAEAPTFALDPLVAHLAAADPGELVRRLRGLAHQETALERLVRQIGETTLAALTRRLEPRHAALILAYLAGLREVHRTQRLVPLSDRELGVALWTLTQLFLLQDPGTQFNRKSFVRRLLVGLAEREGISFDALLATLGRGLVRAGRRGPLRSSLPAVVAALLRDEEIHPHPPRPPRGAAAAEEGQGAAATDPASILLGQRPGSSRPGWVDGLLPKATLAWLAQQVVGRGRAGLAVRPPHGLTPAAWLDHLLASLGPVRPGTPAARLADTIRALRERYPRPSASAARPATARYGGADALRYFLAHGVLPWSARLASPPLTLGALAGELPQWPTALLADALAGAPGGDRGATLWRIARHVPEAELVRWLLRLLPAASDPESPLRSSLSAFAARAEDRGWFFARAIAAVVSGELLDFEALAAKPPDSLAPFDLGEPASWPAHRLKSALVARLLGNGETAISLPAPEDLLRTLARRSPEEARSLLHHLEAAPALGTEWLRESPAGTLEDVARELYPRQLPVLRALLDSLARVPAPFRPRPQDAVRAAVWGELWRREQSEELDAEFFAAVLSQLFAHPLAPSVGRFLRREAGRWALASPLGTRQRDAFLAALSAAEGAQVPAAPPPRPAPPQEERRREELFALLRGEGAAADLDPIEIARRLGEALVSSPVEVYGQLRRGLADSRTRERWSRDLPEAALAQLVALVEPTRHRLLLDTAEVLFAAWGGSGGHGAGPPLPRRELWRALLSFLAQPGHRPHDTAGLARAFSAHLAGLPGLAAGGPGARAERAAAWLDRAAAEAQAAGRPALAAALARERGELLEPWRGRAGRTVPARTGRAPVAKTEHPERRPEDRRRAREKPPGTEPLGDAIYVRNAGLVLLAPFLPRFFDRLGLLESPPPSEPDERPKPRFRDAEALSRGVHFLQYLVDGSLGTPEPALVLNKLLCGAAPAIPVDPEIAAGAEELAVCDSLLGAVISQWPAIAATSTAGLRETFLVREGRLLTGDDGWRLHVQRRTVDFLVDDVPWSFRVVFHPWMAQALHVTW
jgi:hypothetical protein